MKNFSWKNSKNVAFSRVFVIGVYLYFIFIFIFLFAIAGSIGSYNLPFNYYFLIGKVVGICYTRVGKWEASCILDSGCGIS
jgi:hypothetical protein